MRRQFLTLLFLLAVAGCATTEEILTPTGRLEQTGSLKAGTTFVYTADGAHVIVRSPRGGAMYNIASGALVRTFDHSPFTVYSDIQALAVSPDGKHLIGGGGEIYEFGFGGRSVGVVMWEIETGRAIDALLSGLQDYDDKVTALAYSRDGRTIAAMINDRVVTWTRDAYGWDDDVKVSSVAPDRPGYVETTQTLSFSDDGRWLLASPELLWETATLKLVDDYYAWYDDGSLAAFVRGGTHYVTSEESSLVLRELATRESRGAVPLASTVGDYGETEWLRARHLVGSPDGTMFAAIDDAGTLSIYDASNGALVGSATGGGAGVRFAPDSRGIATAASDGTITFWRIDR